MNQTESFILFLFYCQSFFTCRSNLTSSSSSLCDLSGSITTSPNSELETPLRLPILLLPPLHAEVAGRPAGERVNQSLVGHGGGRLSSHPSGSPEKRTSGVGDTALTSTTRSTCGERCPHSSEDRLETGLHLFYWLISMDLIVFGVSSAQTATCLL